MAAPDEETTPTRTFESPDNEEEEKKMSTTPDSSRSGSSGVIDELLSSSNEKMKTPNSSSCRSSGDEPMTDIINQEKEMKTPNSSSSGSTGSSGVIDGDDDVPMLDLINNEKSPVEERDEDEDITLYPSYILEKFPNLTVEYGKSKKASATIVTDEEKRLICPPENPRFQLCCFQVRFKNYRKKGKLFGSILASDRPGKVDWMSPDPTAEIGLVPLFHHELSDAIDDVRNLTFVDINPTIDRSIPASTYLEIIPELYLITDDGDDYIEVAIDFFEIDFRKFWLTRYYDGCHFVVLDGEHGNIKLYYIVIRNAVDAHLEFTLEAEPHLCEKDNYVVSITAYYGPEFKIENSDSVETQCYKIKLFQTRQLAFLKNGKIPLLQSVVAVPANSSLIIHAYVYDYRSDYTYMNKMHTFPAQLSDISDSACLKGEDCRLHLTVNWNYELDT